MPEEVAQYLTLVHLDGRSHTLDPLRREAYTKWPQWLLAQQAQGSRSPPLSRILYGTF